MLSVIFLGRRVTLVDEHEVCSLWHHWLIWGGKQQDWDISCQDAGDFILCHMAVIDNAPCIIKFSSWQRQPIVKSFESPIQSLNFKVTGGLGSGVAHDTCHSRLFKQGFHPSPPQTYQWLVKNCSATVEFILPVRGAQGWVIKNACQLGV